MSVETKKKSYLIWIIMGVVGLFLLSAGCICSGLLGMNMMAAEAQKCGEARTLATCQACCATGKSRLGKKANFDPGASQVCRCH